MNCEGTEVSPHPPLNLSLCPVRSAQLAFISTLTFARNLSSELFIASPGLPGLGMLCLAWLPFPLAAASARRAREGSGHLSGDLHTMNLTDSKKHVQINSGP